MKSGHSLAVFSQSPRSSSPLFEGRAVMISLTSSRRYFLKGAYEGRGLPHSQQMFKVGNEEIMIRDDYTLDLFESKSCSYYDTAGLTALEMVGEPRNPKDQYEYARLEFHQILYE